MRAHMGPYGPQPGPGPNPDWSGRSYKGINRKYAFDFHFYNFGDFMENVLPEFVNMIIGSSAEQLWNYVRIMSRPET